MMTTPYIIKVTASIREALVALDGNTHDWQTLMVVDESERMVGTLTDGDIRRGLIHGAALEDDLSNVMHRNFKFLRVGENDPQKLKALRGQQIFFVPVLDEKGHIVSVTDLLKLRNVLPIDAVIMAGGKGERLRPLTEHTPKPLLPVGDKTIIDHVIDRLISYGVNNISVTVNYLKEQLEEHFAIPRLGVQVQTIREPKYLGTIGSVQFIDHFEHDTILVMNSDLFTNIDLEYFYLHFKELNADMSVAAVPYSVSVPYGILDIDEHQEIKSILEKPSYNYYANAGIYLIKREMIVKYIPENVFCNATDFIEKLISEHKKVVHFPLSGYWIDIGNKQEYAKAKELIQYI